MSINVTFNNYDIQSANIISDKIQHTDFPDRAIEVAEKIGLDGFEILDNKFTFRRIVIKGVLVAADANTLDTNIDTLKKNLSGQAQNLDIDYGGSTRRYIATVEKLEIPEEFFNINFVPFFVTFLCQPFGRDTSATTQTTSNITTSPKTSSITINGSANPKPKITATVVSETNMTQIKFRNTTTSEEITIARSFAASDILVIDTDIPKVTVNGAEVDFTGPFPAFVLDSNGWTLTITDTGAFNVTLEIQYTPLYL